MEQLKEFCIGYAFEGMWPHITFWRTVCYCPSCQTCDAAEVGGEIRDDPRTDPTWVRFQRKRQELVLYFCGLVTFHHQTLQAAGDGRRRVADVYADWLFGASVDLAKQMDWLSSDLYANKHHLSFFAEFLYSLSENKPFEHLNPWAYPNIHERLSRAASII